MPVIANDYGSNREIIDNGKNGFIVRNFDELEKYVTSLLADDVEYLRMSDNAIRSTKRWDVDVLKKKLGRIFQEISTKE